MRPDLWISEAAFERLTNRHWVAKVKVETPEETRIDLHALPVGYHPAQDGGRSVAVELRDYYMEAD